MLYLVFTRGMEPWLGGIAVGGIALLIPYLRWFLKKYAKLGSFLLFGLIGLLPKSAYACAVCFGASSDEQTMQIASAFNLGIELLLGITFLVIAAFLVAVYRIERHRLARDQKLMR